MATSTSGYDGSSSTSSLDWESTARRKSFPNHVSESSSCLDDNDLKFRNGVSTDYFRYSSSSSSTPQNNHFAQGNHQLKQRVVHFDSSICYEQPRRTLTSTSRNVVHSAYREPEGETSGDLNLDVPKLKDMKSHSFPPPWARDDDEAEPEAASETTSTSSSSTSSVASTPEDRERHFFDAYNREEFPLPAVSTCGAFSADERRRRWLQYSHTISECR